MRKEELLKGRLRFDFKKIEWVINIACNNYGQWFDFVNLEEVNNEFDGDCAFCGVHNEFDSDCEFCGVWKFSNKRKIV